MTMRLVSRNEICPVPWNDVVKAFDEVWVFTDFVHHMLIWEKTTLQKGFKAYDPGAVIVVDSKFGCYDPELGWFPGHRAYVNELPVEETPKNRQWGKSDALDLTQHLEETRDFCIDILKAVNITDEELVTKVSVPVGYMTSVRQVTTSSGLSRTATLTQPSCWQKVTPRFVTTPGLRHEVHSAFGCLQL